MGANRHRITAGRHLGAGRLVRLIQDFYVAPNPCLDGNCGDPECPDIDGDGCCDPTGGVGGDGGGVDDNPLNRSFFRSSEVFAQTNGGVTMTGMLALGAIDLIIPSHTQVFSENRSKFNDAAKDDHSATYNISTNLGYARYRKGFAVHDKMPALSYSELKNSKVLTPRMSSGDSTGKINSLSTKQNSGGIDFQADNTIIEKKQVVNLTAKNDPRVTNDLVTDRVYNDNENINPEGISSTVPFSDVNTHVVTNENPRIKRSLPNGKYVADGGWESVVEHGNYGSTPDPFRREALIELFTDCNNQQICANVNCDDLDDTDACYECNNCGGICTVCPNCAPLVACRCLGKICSYACPGGCPVCDTCGCPGSGGPQPCPCGDSECDPANCKAFTECDNCADKLDCEAPCPDVCPENGECGTVSECGICNGDCDPSEFPDGEFCCPTGVGDETGACVPCDTCPDETEIGLSGSTVTKMKGNFGPRDLLSIGYFRHDLNAGNEDNTIAGTRDTVMSCNLVLTVKDVYGRLASVGARPYAKPLKLDIYELNVEIDPDTVNCSQYSTGNAWTSASGRNTTDRGATPVATVTIPTSVTPLDKVHIDITEVARKAARGNGIMNFMVEAGEWFDNSTGLEPAGSNRPPNVAMLVEFYRDGAERPKVVTSIMRGRSNATERVAAGVARRRATAGL